MTSKPKRVLVVSDDRLWAEEAAALFDNKTHVEISPSEGAIDKVQLGEFEGVLASTGSLVFIANQASQERDRILLNSIGEGVCLTDPDGRVLWSNDPFQGYDLLTRSRITATCRQAARQLTDPARPKHILPTAARRFEVTASDDHRVLEVLVSPIWEPSLTSPGSGPVSEVPPGAFIKFLAAVVWDVTQSRRIQQRMMALDRAGDELVRIDAELVRQMHTPERLRVLEQKIVRIAHDLLRFDHFAIRLIDERSGKLELVMSRGLPRVAMEVQMLVSPEGNGISGYVATTGRSYICTDAATDPRYVVGIEGARSSLTVPRRLSDKVIGIFNVESTRPSAFNEEDRQFAERLSNYIALAIHILDLLRVERVETSETVSHTVEDELEAPINELAADVEKLKTAGDDSKLIKRLIERLSGEVDTLKKRVKDVTSGPQTILGAAEAILDAKVDPLLAGKRILVADDEPRMRQIIRDVLSSRGAELVVCEDAVSAIEALRTGAMGPASQATPGSERSAAATPDAPRGFDLLVSDIRLPDKTGYEIFAAATQLAPGMPVILMTGFGYDPHHSIVRASQEGLQCVLFKPFQADVLIQEVHKALGKQNSQQAS
jgi:two-component system, sensor histidine kinase SagS